MKIINYIEYWYYKIFDYDLIQYFTDMTILKDEILFKYRCLK